MLVIGLGTHPKLADLTDGEFRAHVVGVLAVAAMAEPRGLLLVGKLPAEATHIARAAGVPLRVAKAAMAKLEAVGILEHDHSYGCLRVHDWADWNPKPDGTATERKRRQRDRDRDMDPSHADVTRDMAVMSRDVTANVTLSPSLPPHPPLTPVEGEEEAEEKEKSTPLSGKPDEARQVFDAWIISTGRTGRTVFSAERKRIIHNALKVFPLADLLDAVEGWRFSAHHRGENESGTVYNDIELLLKSAKQVEKFRDLKRKAPHLVAVSNGSTSEHDAQTRSNGHYKASSPSGMAERLLATISTTVEGSCEEK